MGTGIRGGDGEGGLQESKSGSDRALNDVEAEVGVSKENLIADVGEEVQRK